MRKTFRFLISALLVLLMTLQCFAAAVPLDADAVPADSAEETETAPEPERDAPVVSAAQVRPSDSETAADLTDGMTLTYNAAVLHFVFADEAGESGAASGVDLASCAVYADERLMSEAAADETDCSLSLSVTFPNGRHVLRVLARDRDGNESETVYTVQVAGSNMTFPVYSVEPTLKYAPLGGTLKLVVRTSNAAYLDALNVCIRIDPAFAPEHTVEAGQGFTLAAGSESYDEATGILRFRVKANVNLSGERDAAVVSFAIDRATPEGTAFRYSVPGVWADTRRADTPNYLESFSLEEQSLAVEAPLILTVDNLYTNMAVTPYFHVLDRGHAPVRDANIYRGDGAWIGRTNWSGVLSVPARYYREAGTFTVYAEKEDMGTSFPVEAKVRDYAGADANSEKIFLPVSGAADSKNAVWISGLYDNVYYRCSEYGDLSERETLKADYSRVPIGDTMVQVNRIALTGLEPDGEYRLETSYDGTTWSPPRRVVVKNPEENLEYSLESSQFFVMGDLAGAPEEDFSRLRDSHYLLQAPFGVFTGDLMENVDSHDEWISLLSKIGLMTGSASMVFAPGEKDLTDGGTAFYGVTNQPEGCFSAENGIVYCAVIPYRENQDYSADLQWLVKDASRSSCRWKVLVMHQPVYSACSDSTALASVFPQALEKAGISFVFSGHDRVFARTSAMKDGKPTENDERSASVFDREDGVVYYICGSVGAHDSKATQPMPEGTFLRDDLTGVFLWADATEESFTVYAIDSEGTEIDRCVMYDSVCVSNGHVFSEKSRCDAAAGTLICDRCGRTVLASESGYTGFASLGTGRAYLDHGHICTGWFSVKDVPYHAGKDARVHQTVAFSTETCTQPGVRMGWCAECRETHSFGTEVPASGHDFDANHRCKNMHYDSDHRTVPCGWTAQNLADLNADLEYRYGFYTGLALTPAVTILTPSGEELDSGEYTVTYSDNVNLGVASAVVAGVNGCYGQITLNFEIRPNEVKSLTLSKITSSEVTFSWSRAAGAQRYAVYQQTGDSWKRLGDTADLTYTVTSLAPGTDYAFRVRPYAIVTDTAKRLDGSTDRTYWAPHNSESLKVTTEGVAFVDVPESAWFAAAVNWAVGANVTQGTGENRFSPSAQCTRGQMVTFLWRAKGCPEPTQTKSPFADVSDPNAYYYKAVLWAVEKGITRGSSATTFSPNAPVTRGMVVTFLHRSAGNTPPARSDSPFVDVESWQYYAQSVQWAVEQKITSGMDATHFSPDTICTRAQIVTFLYRLETGG